MRARGWAVLAAVVLWGAASVAQEQRRPQTHTVVIADMRFTPETIQVARGDTIVWLNKDLVPHTATSPGGRFDSKVIDPGNSWRYTIRRTGRFEYLCTLHPTMEGAIRVR